LRRSAKVGSRWRPHQRIELHRRHGLARHRPPIEGPARYRLR
jgi:hypothetical protein